MIPLDRYLQLPVSLKLNLWAEIEPLFQVVSLPYLGLGYNNNDNNISDYITVCTDSKMRDLEETVYYGSNECIYRAPFVKSLGLFTDENLDWGMILTRFSRKFLQAYQFLNE